MTDPVTDERLTADEILEIRKESYPEVSGRLDKVAIRLCDNLLADREEIRRLQEEVKRWRSQTLEKET